MIRIQKGNINTKAYWDSEHTNPPVEGKDVQKNEIITQHIVDDTKVIEIGSGPGWLISRIATRKPNCELTATDFSDKAINILKKDKRLIVRQADVTKEDVGPANYYNYVICSEVIEHLDKPEQVPKEMHRLLQTGGMAILTTPYGDHIPSSQHVWEFTPEDVRGMFEGLFSQVWVYPWASGGLVAEVESGELVYPSGHLDVTWVIAIK